MRLLPVFAIFMFGILGLVAICKLQPSPLNTWPKLTETRDWLIPDDSGSYKRESTACATAWRGTTDAPNTTVPYIDFGRGIAFEIPYNNVWGCDQYQLAPFEIDKQGVRFGPVVGYCGGGGVCRSMSIRRTPQRSSRLVIEEHTFTPLNIRPSVKTVNGMEVVYWTEGTTGIEIFRAEIVGSNENYLLQSAWAWGSSDDRWQYAEQVLKSFRFLVLD